MRGNSHVRFLGEEAAVTPLPYPASAVVGGLDVGAVRGAGGEGLPGGGERSLTGFAVPGSCHSRPMRALKYGKSAVVGGLDADAI